LLLVQRVVSQQPATKQVNSTGTMHLNEQYVTRQRHSKHGWHAEETGLSELDVTFLALQSFTWRSSWKYPFASIWAVMSVTGFPLLSGNLHLGMHFVHNFGN